VIFNQAGSKIGPILKPAAEIRCRQPPEQPVAEIEVDPVGAMPARDQRSCDALEEARLRPLQKEERAGDQITIFSRSLAIAAWS
jgi:hypothetical protein